MSLLHDAKAAIGANPGVHALIIGVSEYPHLAGGQQPVADPWGMDQLTSTASTAHEVFEWLKGARLPLPLATCRVLLSPSPSEPHLKGIAEHATFANVFNDAQAWRADANSDPANITFFYFAGHGVQRTKEDAVLCLHDFRAPPATAPALRHAIDVATLSGGMSPSPTQDSIARTQFYFVDACRVQPEQLKRFDDPKTGQLWDLESGGQDDRSAPVFFASVSNHVAAASPGGQTLFGQALLDCFKGGAGDSLGEDAAGDSEWGVTVQSLNQALLKRVDDINRDLGGDQSYTISGLTKPALLCRLDQAPLVEVVLRVDPEAAAQLSHLLIKGNAQPDRVFTPPFVHPVEDRLNAGSYSIELSFHPPAPPYLDRTRFKEARAPRTDWRVKVVD
jgi:hypothetical protein